MVRAHEAPHPTSSPEGTPMDARSEFASLVTRLASYFAAEPAAVSVNTEKYGTLTREDVARLAVLLAK